MSTWADCTLREFDALNLLAGDGIAALNEYWDNLHADPANVARGDEPNRLSESGAAWFAELQDRVRVLDTSSRAAGADITPYRDIARELLSSLGFMSVCNAAAILRGRSRWAS